MAGLAVGRFMLASSGNGLAGSGGFTLRVNATLRALVRVCLTVNANLLTGYANLHD